MIGLACLFRHTALLLPACVALCACTPGESSIDIEQAQLQRRLEQKFPLGNCRKPVVCFELSEPNVLLTEGSERIGLSFKLAVRVGGTVNLPGAVTFTGKLRYAREQASFFFDDIQIDKFELAGLPGKVADGVKLRGPELLRALLEQYPVYTIQGESHQAEMARRALREIRVVNGKLRITFSALPG